MAISAIIRCHEDPRVLECIETLRENETVYEVVVVLTETSQKIAALLKNIPEVKIAWASVGNLSKSSNIGIEASSCDKFAILDADVRCSGGYLDILDRDLDHYLLVKPQIIFESQKKIEGIIAKLKEYVYQSGVFYCPGIAFRKELKNHIGGYYFDDNVWWTEDAEMNYRIKKAGLPIYHEKEAVVNHAPESFQHDLKSAYKIGQGKYSQVVHTGRDTYEENIRNTLKRILNGETFKNLWDLYKHSKSLGVLIYSLIWNLFYYFGYYEAKIIKKKA